MPASTPLLGVSVSLSASAAGSAVDPLTGTAIPAAPSSKNQPAAAASSPPIAAPPAVATASNAATAGTSQAAIAAAGAPAAAPLQAVLPQVAPGAPVAPIAPAAIPAVGAPLKPATKPGGTPKPVRSASFASQFKVDLADLNHLLKLANPSKYGKVFATDVFGASYEISGARPINSFGNNLANAGADGQYGTAALHH